MTTSFSPALVRTSSDRNELVPHSSDRETFLALVDAHGAAIMAFLRRLCGNPHDAEDLFQETAVRVWRNLATRPRLRNPGGWLMTIAYRTFLDWRARRPPSVELGHLVDHRCDSPYDAAQRSEECGRVQTAIAALPDSMREVVVLHYSGGLSLNKTAAAMNIPAGTVKSRLSSALAQLRSALE